MKRWILIFSNDDRREFFARNSDDCFLAMRAESKDLPVVSYRRAD